MFNLKGLYFYFLAIKIALVKFLKRLYFTTKYYNNSLRSNIPSRFYFYPNSFLLSSFTNHKNFSFKIEDIDSKTFWNKQSTKKDKRALHSFYWLSLIDRKNNTLIIQNIISEWIGKNNNYKKTIWDSAILSKRVISWILNADIILNNTDKSFKNSFLQSIIIQINHLKKNVKFQNNDSKKIEVISAILLSGLVFKEYSDNFDSALKELKKLIENFFDTEGFPINKNPADLIKFSKYLILIKECSKDAQNYIPDYIDEIIEKNLNCLTSIKTPNEETPLFNGNTESKVEDYFNYIKNLNYKLSNNSKTLVGNIQIVKNKKHSIFFDVGEPPKKHYSNSYQSGPLSFEYFINEDKIITNCGFGIQISKKAELLSRLTSAQSTLCLGDTSVTKFERNKLVNKAFGTSVKNSFKIFDTIYKDNTSSITITASHNAYEKKFGYIHKRSIEIVKKNNELFGSDYLIKKTDNASNTNYSIRFHLYPGITAVKTIGGSSILLQIEKNKSLVFTSSKENISIEKSIFLGRNQILNNFCITIYGNVSNEEKVINWEFRKSK